MWAVGLLLYSMLTGKEPFWEHDNIYSIYFVLGQGYKNAPADMFQVECDAECRDFMDRCLDWDPDSRASVVELLEHVFLNI